MREPLKTAGNSLLTPDFPFGWCACQLPCPNRPSPAANQAFSLFAFFCDTAQVKNRKPWATPGKAGGSPSVISLSR